MLDLASVQCGLEVDANLPDHPLDPKFRQELFFAFKEALTNVVRHSNAKQVRLMIAVQSGELRVEVVDDGDHVVLRVSDDGPGVPPGEAESIFLPFFTSRPRPESTGLGLPVAREIAAAHRGTLERESVATGASFRLSIPKASQSR